MSGCGKPATPSGSGSSEKPSITIKGSDTMVILGQKWAEVYMEKNPDVAVQVTGGGSGVGIAALLNGTTDIAQSSRPMKDEEKEDVKKKFQKEANEVAVAKDGLSIYVHDSNPLTEITIPQLKAIYTGKVTNWKEVGGPDEKIILYSRENNSGTYAYFKEHVLEEEDFAPQAQNLPGTASVVNAVSKDPLGIGYGGIAYGKGIKHLKVAAKEGDPAIEPTTETIMSGKYPISRDLYLYTVGEPKDYVQAYIDWTLSEEGQKIVEEVEYIPIGAATPPPAAP